MGRRAARNLHLALWLLGVGLYIVFVIPRWWVLTGDIPATLATAGRIAAGVPIAAAAVPVALLLRGALRDTAGGDEAAPEIALRLRAWSGVLHVVAGVLIVMTAIAEVWLRSPAAGPWLFAIYGAAGAIAILAALAFVLSFIAERPPAPPKPAKVKKPKTPRGKKQRKDEPAAPADDLSGDDLSGDDLSGDESDSVEEPAADTESESDAVADTDTDTDTEESGALRNKRPSGKSRLRLGR